MLLPSETVRKVIYAHLTVGTLLSSLKLFGGDPRGGYVAIAGNRAYQLMQMYESLIPALEAALAALDEA